MHEIVDAIREVTACVQRAIEDGHRSREIDADDLVEVLLAIADRLVPPLANVEACPQCGERSGLVWQDDATVRCSKCWTIFRPE